MSTTKKSTRAWGRALAGVAGATTLALSLIGVLPVATTAPAAQAAPAPAPVCAEITPASLNATYTDVSGRPHIVFNGTLTDGTKAGSCVKLPIPSGLSPLAYRSYEAPDKDGVKVGTMVVQNKLITFVFDDAYVTSHNSVTFKGEVTFGINRDTTKNYEEYEITWTLPGSATSVVIPVAACPNCTLGTVWTGKFAVINQAGDGIDSGIRIGTDLAEKHRQLPLGARVTIKDVIGPGQICKYGTLTTMPGNKPIIDGKIKCTSDSFIEVTVPAAYIGTTMTFAVFTEITAMQDEYTDTGTISATGLEEKVTPAFAHWAKGSAEGSGVTPTPTPTPSTSTPSTPVSTPTPTPSTTSTPTPTPSATSTPKPTPTQTETPRPTPSTPAPTQTPKPTPSAPAPTQTPAPKPTPTPTPKPTLPGKAVTVTRTFQVDRYTPKTAAIAGVTARLDDDRLLHYREDRPLWGQSKWEFVTVKVPAKATTAQLVAAINAATGSVGDIRTTAQLDRITAGTGVTMAWELGPDATRAKPWGPRNATSQRYIGRS